MAYAKKKKTNDANTGVPEGAGGGNVNGGAVGAGAETLKGPGLDARQGPGAAAAEGVMNGGPSISPDMAFFEEMVAQRILACVDALGRRFGRNKLAGVLIGVSSNYVIEAASQVAPHYGSLARFSRKEALTMVDQLIGRGLIRIVGVELPLLELTDEGKEALRDGCGARVRMPFRLAPRAVPVPADARLYELIRGWRARTARGENLPVYCIFKNQELLELVKRKPLTVVQLAEVPGFSEKRIEKYGEELLQLINDYNDGKIPAEDGCGGDGAGDDGGAAISGDGASAPPRARSAYAGPDVPPSQGGASAPRDFRTAAEIARENGLA